MAVAAIAVLGIGDWGAKWKRLVYRSGWRPLSFKTKDQAGAVDNPFPSQ